MLENQIRGLAVVFGVRLPRGLSPSFVDQVIGMSDGITGLAGAMRGLVAARDAVRKAIAAIDADIKKLAHESDAWHHPPVSGLPKPPKLAQKPQFSVVF